MRLLLDQDVYSLTTRFLREGGHDVVLAADLGMSQAHDESILQAAHDRQRLFVTRDRDFGNLVFVRGLGYGVIYLRMQPSTMADVHAELARVLQLYPASVLQGAFVVIESNGHRIRHIPK